MWTLAPSFLEQRRLRLPEAGASAEFTALATAERSTCTAAVLDAHMKDATSAAAFVADNSGNLWQIAIGAGWVHTRLC
jgi:hypothetical protein